MRLWLAALLVACSSSSGPDPCERAFSKMSALGMYGGADYGAPDAIALGMACRDLWKEDFACIDAAKSTVDVGACSHALTTTGEQKTLLMSTRNEGVPPDTADVVALTDATCKCKDTACLVGVGERNRERITRFAKSGAPSDPDALASLKKMRACLDGLGAPAAPAAPPRPPQRDDDFEGKLRFFADQMCACTTASCAKAVQATATQWESTASPNTKPDDATVKRIEAEMDRLADCTTKLLPATP